MKNVSTMTNAQLINIAVQSEKIFFEDKLKHRIYGNLLSTTLKEIHSRKITKEWYRETTPTLNRKLALLRMMGVFNNLSVDMNDVLKELGCE